MCIVQCVPYYVRWAIVRLWDIYDRYYAMRHVRWVLCYETCTIGTMLWDMYVVQLCNETCVHRANIDPKQSMFSSRSRCVQNSSPSAPPTYYSSYCYCCNAHFALSGEIPGSLQGLPEPPGPPWSSRPPIHPKVPWASCFVEWSAGSSIVN